MAETAAPERVAPESVAPHSVAVDTLHRKFGLDQESAIPRERFPRLHRLLADTAEAEASGNLSVPIGTVSAIGQNVIALHGLSRHARLDDYVEIRTRPEPMIARVIAITGDIVKVNPLANAAAARIGDEAHLKGPLQFSPDLSWRGRVLDAFCRPIDGKGPVNPGRNGKSEAGQPPAAMKRGRIRERVVTGITAIDLFTPLSYGQRLGIMGGTGTGKSSLLAHFVNSGSFDAVVVAMIGERGREVREFVEDGLGDRLDNATIFATTSDETPPMRVLAADSAMRTAEFFRDQGMHVLLLFDSVTRYAHAIREVSLAAGEMPVVRGHTTMLYSALSRLLERAGPGENEGTITGIYSVLVEGDDHNEPVSDAARGILDGHVVLDRAIAESGRYPAIDVSRSISRLSNATVEPRHRAIIDRARHLISLHAQVEEMRQIGGYVEGADPLADLALGVAPKIYALISQASDESAAANIDPFLRLEALLREAGALDDPPPPPTSVPQSSVQQSSVQTGPEQ